MNKFQLENLLEVIKYERLKGRKFSDTVAKNRGLYPLICKLMNFSDPEKSLVTPDSLLKNYNTCLSSLENMVAEKKHTEIQSTVDSTNEAVKLFPSTRPEFLLTIVSEEVTKFIKGVTLFLTGYNNLPEAVRNLFDIHEQNLQILDAARNGRLDDEELVNQGEIN